jgi:hypothetical protein
VSDLEEWAVIEEFRRMAAADGGEEMVEDEEQPLWDGDGPVPMIPRGVGYEVPDLSRVKPERRLEALLPFDRKRRVDAVHSQHLPLEEVGRLFEQLDDLPPPPREIAKTAIEAGLAIPSPVARRGRQVNVRFSPDDHADLLAAADIAGTTPTTLARMLVNNGVRRILAEQGAAYAQFRATRGTRRAT